MLLRKPVEGEVEDVWATEDSGKSFQKQESRALAQRLVLDKCLLVLCLGGDIRQRVKSKVTASLWSLTAIVQITGQNKHWLPAFTEQHWTARGSRQVGKHRCGRKDRERCLSWGPWMMHPRTRSTWARNMAVHKCMAAWNGGLPSFYLQLLPHEEAPSWCLWSRHRGCSWPGARFFSRKFTCSCWDEGAGGGGGVWCRQRWQWRH